MQPDAIVRLPPGRAGLVLLQGLLRFLFLSSLSPFRQHKLSDSVNLKRFQVLAKGKGLAGTRKGGSG
eukprot:525386-Hanusia_phi.AAC.1